MNHFSLGGDEVHTKINEKTASLPEKLALLVTAFNTDFCDARKEEHVDCTHSGYAVDHIASVRLTEADDNSRILIYTLNGEMTRCFFGQPFDNHVGEDLAEQSVGASFIDQMNLVSSAKQLAHVITSFYSLITDHPGNQYSAPDFD